MRPRVPQGIGLRPLLLLVMIVVAGFALTGGAWWLAQSREHEAATAEFEAEVRERIAAFERELQANFTAVRSVPGFFAASVFVDRSEFGTYSATLLDDYPALTSIYWAPLVPDPARSNLVLATQAEGCVGKDPCQTRRFGIDHPLSGKPWYAPVVYAEPRSANVPLGLDLFGYEGMDGLLAGAVAGSTLTLSSETNLPFDLRGLAFAAIPILADDLSAPDRYPAGTVDAELPVTGFIVASFDVTVLLSSAISALPDVSIGFSVTDVTARGTALVLSSQAGSRPAGSTLTARISPLGR